MEGSRPGVRVDTREAWREARLALLAEEKALTRARDRVAALRRELPWVEVEDVTFAGEHGPVRLSELFGDHSQLVVQHFMFAPEWAAGCKSCSFWADGFERSRVHLAARDVAFAAVSRAPIAAILAFRTRMGWTFPWVSSLETRFNQDYGVTIEDGAVDPEYNFGPIAPGSGELPGLSVFARDPERAGAIFHTYACYARGLDPLNTTYALLDLVPKGRDEAELPWPMAWIRHRDAYTR